jgi:hypothetical protein
MVSFQMDENQIIQQSEMLSICDEEDLKDIGLPK